MRRKSRERVWRPSDLTRTSGRFWSPEAPWNVPLPKVARGTSLRGFGELVVSVDVGAPTIVYGGPGARPSGRPWQAFVDFDRRTVACGEVWQDPPEGEGPDLQTVSLDGDGWGSRAVGLVLQRELIGRGGIPHAVGLTTPDPELYGLRVRIRDWGFRKVGPVTRTVGEALVTYGGVFMAIVDGPIAVRCEHSSTATSADQVGLYRGWGIGEDRAPIGIPTSDLEVLSTI